MTDATTDWAPLLEEAGPRWAANEAPVREARNHLRKLDARLANAAVERRGTLMRTLAQTAGIDLASLQAEHAKGSELRQRALKGAMEKLGGSLDALAGHSRRLSSSVERVRRELPTPEHQPLVDGASGGGGGSSVACMIRPLDTLDEVDFADLSGGEANLFSFTPIGQGARARVQLWTTGGSTYETRYGWAFGWRAKGTGMATIGCNHLLAGVMGVTAGTDCWGPVQGAVAQLSTFVELEVHREGMPVLEFPRQSTLIKGLSALEGQSDTAKVVGSYDHSHSPIPVVRGDRVLARVGIRMLAYTGGSSLASLDFLAGKEAGDRVTCAWAVLNGTP